MMNKCIAMTIKNQRCKFNVQKNDELCTRHNRLRDNGRYVKCINYHYHNHNEIIDNADEVIVNENVIVNNNDEGIVNENVIINNNVIVNDNVIVGNVIIENIVEDTVENIIVDVDNKNEKMIECICCFDTYEPNKIISCTKSHDMMRDNKHTMCHECTKMFVENVINDKKKIKCIFNKECDGEYDDYDLENILDKKMYERYKEYMKVDLATRLAPILDNYHLCPFCSKYGIIIDNVPGYNNHHVKTIECMNDECRTTWCVICRKAYHGNDPCNKIYTDSHDILNKTINETIDSAMIHNCPKCFTKYNKEDGCNLMTCPSCDAHSCYLCGMLINPINGVKYWHFKGSGSADNNAMCPLYNVIDPTSKYTSDDVTKANIEFNNKKVIDALNNLIEINKEDLAIVIGIKKNLVNRGYKQFEEKKTLCLSKVFYQGAVSKRDDVIRFKKYPKKYPKVKKNPKIQ